MHILRLSCENIKPHYRVNKVALITARGSKKSQALPAASRGHSRVIIGIDDTFDYLLLLTLQMRGELAAADERLVQLTFFRLFPLAQPPLFLDLLIQECLVYLQMSGKQSRESLRIEATSQMLDPYVMLR